MKSLLLIGPDAIHTFNYLDLVRSHFKKIWVITHGSKFDDDDVTTYTVKFSFRNIFIIWKSVLEIRQIIKVHQPDVIHIQEVGTHAMLVFWANRKQKVPVILTGWGSDVLKMPRRGYIFRWLVSKALKKADYLSADSKNLGDYMRALVPRTKLDITIANFGVENVTEDFPKEKIIYSNRLHEELYRIEWIIKAFKLFIDTDNIRDWKLVIAGAGTKTKSYVDLVRRLGLEDYVEFPGWIKREVNREYYKKAMVYVSIPQSDATSISLLEALAYGCIPVLSDLPANWEWVENGRNGLIVKHLDTNYIKKALKLNQPEIAVKNRQIIEERGTTEVNRQKFIDIYNRAIK